MPNLFQRFLAPPARKANEPLAALDRLVPARADERGPEWARPVYGDYYATTVPIYSAVKRRADAVARARMKVWARDSEGELVWVGENHPVQRLLDRMNPFWSHANVWRGLETYLSLWGSGFIWLNRPSMDPVTWEFWLLRPDKVAVVKDKAKYIKGFVYDPMGARFPMLPEEVLWFRYFNPLDEFSGLSPIAPVRLVADMRNDMWRSNRETFRQGILAQNLAFFLKGALDQYAVEEFQDRLMERYSGASKGNKPFVLQADLADVKNLGLSNREMEWPLGLKASKDEIWTALGVPEELFPGAEGTTFANREEARREFYDTTVTQEWALIEAEMQERFIPALPSQYGDLICAFDRSGIEALADNLDELSTRVRAELLAGGVTVNEFRQTLGYDALPSGDVIYLPQGVIPVPVASLEDGAPMGGGNTGDGDGQAALVASRRRATEPDDETVVRQFSGRVDATAVSFAELQDTLFTEQRADVKRALAEQQRAVRRDATNGFDEERWNAVYGQRGRSEIEDMLRRSALAQAAEFALDVDFNIGAPMTQAWIDERTAFWARSVNAETARMLTDEMTAGLAEGESIRQLQGRVDQVFDFNVAFRTERIARTEATAAGNAGHIEVYRQAGIERKRWVAALDGRTREAHREAHGQTVELDQPFVVGGEAMPAPGQGSASNVVNCRCTTTPVLAQRALLPSSVQPPMASKTIRHVVHERNGDGAIMDETINVTERS